MKKERPDIKSDSSWDFEYSVSKQKVEFTFSGRKVFRYNSGPSVGREGNFQKNFWWGRKNECDHLQFFGPSVMINLSIQLWYTLAIVIYIEEENLPKKLWKTSKNRRGRHQKHGKAHRPAGGKRRRPERVPQLGAGLTGLFQSCENWDCYQRAVNWDWGQTVTPRTARGCAGSASISFYVSARNNPW